MHEQIISSCIGLTIHVSKCEIVSMESGTIEKCFQLFGNGRIHRSQQPSNHHRVGGMTYLPFFTFLVRRLVVALLHKPLKSLCLDNALLTSTNSGSSLFPRT